MLNETRLAPHPSMMPKAVQICHDITKAPRICLGAISAERIGTVTSFSPIPRPRMNRVPMSSGHLCVAADASGAMTLQIDPRKIVSRRPR